LLEAHEHQQRPTIVVVLALPRCAAPPATSSCGRRASTLAAPPGSSSRSSFAALRSLATHARGEEGGKEGKIDFGGSGWLVIYIYIYIYINIYMYVYTHTHDDTKNAPGCILVRRCTDPTHRAQLPPDPTGSD
jgi:hypothetical protein